MSKTKLKASSKRFFYLLKMSIISFVSMGILIGYHGAAIVNSLIGMIWFIFAITAGMVLMSSVTPEKNYAVSDEDCEDELSNEFISVNQKNTKQLRSRGESSKRLVESA